MDEPPLNVWQRDEPDSPCVNICLIHPEAKICIGCFRSAGEIRDWPGMEPALRQSLRAELPARQSLVKPKRRGGARSRKPKPAP